jgi:hypothetical protein
VRQQGTRAPSAAQRADFESARREIEKIAKPGTQRIPVSVDLPLSEHAKLALTYAMEEADRLNSKRIGSEHLLLGLLHNNEFASAKVLAQFGASLESLRKRVEALPRRIDLMAPPQLRQRVLDSVREQRRAPLTPLTVEIHGKKWNLEEVRSIVVRLKSQPYLWERKLWKARNIVYERNRKRFSFDTTLAKDETQFVLVKGGWKKDYCAICQWELFETDEAAHGTGYTNGKDWVCEFNMPRFFIRPNSARRDSNKQPGFTTATMVLSETRGL